MVNRTDFRMSCFGVQQIEIFQKRHHSINGWDKDIGKSDQAIDNP